MIENHSTSNQIPIALDHHSYIPSPIFYYDQSNSPLIIDSDPFCSRKISNLFVNFAGDYFYTQNVSQIPEYPGSDSPWAEFVRAFSDQPAAINFVRSLTTLLKDSINEEPASGPHIPFSSPISLTPQPSLGVKPEEMGLTMNFPPQPLNSVLMDRSISGHIGISTAQDLDDRLPQPQKDFLHLPKESFVENNLEHHLESRILKPPVNYNILPSTHKPSSIRRTKGGDRSCEYPDCRTEAGFNFPGQVRRRFCRKHRLEGMVSVVKYKSCEFSGCSKLPLWNFDGETVRKFCYLHKVEGMINLKGKRCLHAGCKTIASCNFEDETTKLYCGKHKLKGMIVIGVPRCAHPGCSIGALHNFQGLKKGKYCAKHKLKGMLHVSSKFCENPKCKRKASYNFHGEKKGRCCRDHRLKGMVNVFYNTCESDGCFNLAYYNHKGQKKGKYCHAHKVEGMVSVIAVKPLQCQYPDCTNNAMFKVKGERKVQYCADHKSEQMIPKNLNFCDHPECLEVATSNYAGERKKYCENHSLPGMIDISKRQNNKPSTCEAEECSKYAWYNFDGEAKPRFCRDHMTKGMISLYKKICEDQDCLEAAHYNYPQESKEKYCIAHKMEGMVRVRRNSRQCAQQGCEKQSSFNVAGIKRPLYCAEHKEPGMVNVLKKRIVCVVPECGKIANYNLKGEPDPRFCKQHKSDEMISLTWQRLCQHAGCEKYGSFEYEGLKNGRRFCKEHKLEGMVNKTTSNRKKKLKIASPSAGRKQRNPTKPRSAKRKKKCEMDRCTNLPTHNFEGAEGGRMCNIHAMAGMIQLKTEEGVQLMSI